MCVVADSVSDTAGAEYTLLHFRETKPRRRKHRLGPKVHSVDDSGAGSSANTTPSVGSDESPGSGSDGEGSGRSSSEDDGEREGEGGGVPVVQVMVERIPSDFVIPEGDGDGVANGCSAVPAGGKLKIF